MSRLVVYHNQHFLCSVLDSFHLENIDTVREHSWARKPRRSKFPVVGAHFCSHCRIAQPAQAAESVQDNHCIYGCSQKSLDTSQLIDIVAHPQGAAASQGIDDPPWEVHIYHIVENDHLPAVSHIAESAHLQAVYHIAENGHHVDSNRPCHSAKRSERGQVKPCMI